MSRIWQNHEIMIYPSNFRLYITDLILCVKHTLCYAITDVTYRIYFNGIPDCHQWTDTSIKEKISDINTQIIHGIWSQDQCDQIPEFFALNSNRAYYSCPENQKIKDSVVYNFHLLGSYIANTTMLVSCLDQWIRESINIPVNGVSLRIIKECTGVLNKGISTECSYRPHGTKSKMPWEAWLSVAFASVLIVLFVIIIIISIKFW